MTAICVIGTELSARLQNVLTLCQVAALLIFAAVALIKVYTDNATPDSITPEASWFSPFAVDNFCALVSALLIGVFIYWGWESAVNLTEETTDSTRAPGLAAIVSTLVLLVTYVGVTTAVVAYAGVGELEEFDDDESIFAVLGEGVLGTPLGQVRRARHRDLGDLVDADDDHPGLANDVLDGASGRVAPSLRRRSTLASERPRSRRSSSPLARRSGTCRRTSSPRTSSSTRSRLSR